MMRNSKKIIPGLTLLMWVLMSTGCDIQTSQEPGILEGKILIGPICPVETDPPDPGCLPRAETYRAYPVGVWTADGGKRLLQINPALDGSYKNYLEPGRYLIKLENDRRSFGRSNLPVEVSIVSNNITMLNIDIDTGIR